MFLALSLRLKRYNYSNTFLRPNISIIINNKHKIPVTRSARETFLCPALLLVSASLTKKFGKCFKFRENFFENLLKILTNYLEIGLNLTNNLSETFSKIFKIFSKYSYNFIQNLFLVSYNRLSKFI